MVAWFLFAFSVALWVSLFIPVVILWMKVKYKDED